MRMMGSKYLAHHCAPLFVLALPLIIFYLTGLLNWPLDHLLLTLWPISLMTLKAQLALPSWHSQNPLALLCQVKHTPVW